MGTDEIEAFLNHLAVNSSVSKSPQATALSRDEKTETEEDDPYADYKILDGLMW